MFKILGPGVYRRHNGEVIEIVALGNTLGAPLWIKKGSEYCGNRRRMEFFDSFIKNGQVDSFQPTPFDLEECIKIVSTPSAGHLHGCPDVATAEQNFAAAFSDVPAAGTMETSSDRLGPRLRYRSEVVVNDSVAIAEAIQFVIQKCGIPAVTEALILAKNQKEAFQKLFAEAVNQTVKRGIHSNAEVTVTFL